MSSVIWLVRLPGDSRRLLSISWMFLSIALAISSARVRTNIVIPLVRRFAPRRADRMRVQQVDVPARVRQAFEQLGPTFVKLGQILSVRPDVVPPEFITEFEKLQSRVPPFPYEQVIQILTTQLRNPPEILFRHFDPEPLAAASLAQVHSAILLTGDKVAIKVQRPGVSKVVEQDIRLLRWLARFAEKRIPSIRDYRPVNLVEEFADWATRELDFRIEALNADHFRYDFRDDPNVYVPKIYWDMTTATLLAMEFVDGATVDNSRKMDALGIDRVELARRGAHSLLKQIFLHGFFHGDPHPGNFFALPGNVMCYHDFGIVGHIPKDLRRELTSFFIAFTEADTEAAAKHMFHVARPMEGADLGRFERDITDLIGAWHYTGRQSLARTFMEILRTGAERRVAFPSALALLGKALVTVESVGLSLYPEFDIEKEFHPFFIEVVKDWLSPEKALRAVKSDVLDYAHALQESPRRVFEVTDTLARGEVSIKIDQAELRSLLAQMRRTSFAQVVGPLGLAVIIASAVAFHAVGVTSVMGIPITAVWLVGAMILGLWLLLALFRR